MQQPTSSQLDAGLDDWRKLTAQAIHARFRAGDFATGAT
jgi:hypothetical protein